MTARSTWPSHRRSRMPCTSRSRSFARCCSRSRLTQPAGIPLPVRRVESADSSHFAAVVHPVAWYRLALSPTGGIPKESNMQLRVRFWVTLLVLSAVPSVASADNPIEPAAGSWRTWIISSAADYRAPAPPGASQTQAEIRQIAGILAQIGPAEQAQITYWDAGAPAYRWMGLLHARSDAGQPLTTYPARLYAYVAIAMYDATIATWESKYYYQRLRPRDIRRNLPAILPVPESPSYPSEHAST